MIADRPRAAIDVAAVDCLIVTSMPVLMGLLGIFSLARFSRFLDAVADVEHFHDITMID